MLTILGAPNSHLMSDEYDNMSSQLRDDDSQDAETIETASYMDGDDGYGSQYIPGSRKRKRGQDAADRQHTIFADALLDYFIISASEGQMPRAVPPSIPPNFEINRPIDDHGHTALHWAVAMGDVEIVQTLVQRGADINVRNKRGETPLIRAVIFTNNQEKDTLPQILAYLQESITQTDTYSASVLHHTLMTTNSRARRKCALYYLEILLNTLSHLLGSKLDRLLDHQDSKGDTAFHMAARHDSKRCVRMLSQYGARGDIPNLRGETADSIFESHRSVHQEPLSSSPLPVDMDHVHRLDGSTPTKSLPMTHFQAEPARSFSQSFQSLAQEKCLQISLAMDNDYRNRNVAYEEAQQAIEKVERDRELLDHEELQLSSQDLGNDEHEFARLEQEYNDLVRHGQAFSEQIQHRELHQSIREAEDQLPKDAHFNMPNGPLPDNQLEERVRAALELAFEQNKRRRLTAENIDARALAGMSSNGEALKRLVADTTSVPIEQVVDVAPELLQALQDEKTDLNVDIPIGA